MTKGRRAADRRRERGQDGDVEDDGSLTTPGASPLDPEEFEEVGSVSYQPPADGPPDLVVDEAPRVPTKTGAVPAVRSRRLHSGDAEPDADEAFRAALMRAQGPSDQPITEVRKAPTQKKRGGLVLVVLPTGDGPRVPLTTTPSLIGRDPVSELHIEDPAVSARHAELVYDDVTGVFTLFDLGSTSGTLVNGAAIDAATDLTHGDLLQFGETVLRFLRAKETPQPRALPAHAPEPTTQDAERSGAGEKSGTREAPAAERSGLRSVDGNTKEVSSRAQAPKEPTRSRRAPQPPSRPSAQQRHIRRMATGVIVASVLLLGVAVAGVAFRRTLFPDDSQAQIRGQLATLKAEARQRLQAQDVDGALARVQTLLALAPDDEEVKSLDRVVATESDARDALQLGLRLGDEDRDDEADVVLRKIADASLFAGQRDALRAQLKDRAQQRSLRQIEGHLERGQIDLAKALLAAHLERFPDDARARALLARLQGAAASPSAELQRARTLFAQGDLEGAKAAAQKAGALGFVADVDRFAASLAQGKAALSRLEGSEAVPALDEALRLLQGLGAGPAAAVFSDVKKPYANALYLSGTEKLDDGDLCGGARDLFRAGRLEPGDAKVQAQIRTLDERAQQGLEAARGAKSFDPEQAASIARKHLCLAKSSSRVHDELKALARL